MVDTKESAVTGLTRAQEEVISKSLAELPKDKYYS